MNPFTSTKFRALYLERRRAEIPKLYEALHNESFELFQLIGHQLQGNASSFGFDPLADLGVKLEKAGNEKNHALAKDTLEAFENFLSQLNLQ